jgi:hypothetical protein
MPDRMRDAYEAWFEAHEKNYCGRCGAVIATRLRLVDDFADDATEQPCTACRP